jgi:hypothetical protein
MVRVFVLNAYGVAADPSCVGGLLSNTQIFGGEIRCMFLILFGRIGDKTGLDREHMKGRRDRHGGHFGVDRLCESDAIAIVEVCDDGVDALARRRVEDVAHYLADGFQIFSN